MAVTCDPQVLVDQAKCLDCNIPPGMQLPVLIYLACQLANTSAAAGGSGSINISAGTTSNNLSAVTFSNANGVSFGINNSTITASVAGGAALTNVNISAGTTSNNLSNLVFSNSNRVSFGLNGSTVTAQHALNFSAGTTSNDITNGVTFSNSNGVSFGLNASTITASVATSLTNLNVSAGTTSNNLSAITFSNSNNVTFGLNASTLTASVTVASTQGSINLSAGTTSNLASAFTFSNSNGVSFGLNASTITASIATSLTNMNVSAGTTSNNLSALTFSNANNVSFGLNASTITASVVAPVTMSYYNNAEYVQGTISHTAANQSTSYVFPFIVPQNLSVSYIRFPVSGSIAASTSFGTTNGASMGFTLSSTINVVIYSVGTGANSRSLQSVASGSASWAQLVTLTAVGGVGSQASSGWTVSFPREGAASTSFTNTTAFTSTRYDFDSSRLTNFTSNRFLDVPFANSLSPGAYWMAYGSSTSLSTSSNPGLTNLIISMSNMFVSQPNNTYGLMGSGTNSSNGQFIGIGSFTTNAIATTASIALANISSSASHPIMPFEMIRQA